MSRGRQSARQHGDSVFPLLLSLSPVLSHSLSFAANAATDCLTRSCGGRKTQQRGTQAGNDSNATQHDATTRHEHDDDDDNDGATTTHIVAWQRHATRARARAPRKCVGLPVHVIKERVQIAQRERERERERQMVYTREIHIRREDAQHRERGRGGEEKEREKKR